MAGAAGTCLRSVSWTAQFRCPQSSSHFGFPYGPIALFFLHQNNKHLGGWLVRSVGQAKLEIDANHAMASWVKLLLIVPYPATLKGRNGLQHCTLKSSNSTFCPRLHWFWSPHRPVSFFARQQTIPFLVVTEEAPKEGKKEAWDRLVSLSSSHSLSLSLFVHILYMCITHTICIDKNSTHTYIYIVRTTYIHVLYAHNTCM